MDTPFGINTTLPPYEEQETEAEINKRNIYTVMVNQYDQLLVNNNPMILDNLKNGVKNFVNNYGRDSRLSVSPKKPLSRFNVKEEHHTKLILKFETKFPKHILNLEIMRLKVYMVKIFQNLKLQKKT